MLTVAQVSELAGITPRTLHHYDRIGLLRPSRVGENGYRYYDTEALLRLQQVLLYRELAIPLKEIKHLLGRSDFDIAIALEEHRTGLVRRIERLRKIVATVDETLSHVKGEREMNAPEIFAGFSEEEERRFQREAEERYDPETVRESNRRWRSTTPEERSRILAEGNAIYRDLGRSMERGAESPEAQACIDRWRKNLSFFWEPDLDQLIGLAELYNRDERFKSNFDRVDPALSAFMRDAVRYYVETRRGNR